MLDNIDKRKLFLIIVVLGVIILLALFLYFIWREPQGEPSGLEGNQNITPGQLPPTGAGNVNISGGGNVNLPATGTQTGTLGPITGSVSPVASGSYTEVPQAVQGIAKNPMSTSSGERYYNPADGKFYELSSGSAKALNDIPYYDVKDVTWSQTGQSAVLEFPDGSNIVYDFATKKQYTLPAEMTEFSFSPDSSQIAGKFLGDNAADKWLVTISNTGSGLKGIEPLGDNEDKVEVAWSPKSQVVALSRTGEPQGNFSQEVLLIGLDGENFRSLQVEGRGFESTWTPSGDNLVYSVYNDKSNYKPELWVVDGTVDNIGYNKRNLGLPTWVDKCTFSADSTTGFCAVPQNLPEGAGYIKELANGLPDTFYRIDLKTGTSTLIALPVADSNNYISATNLNLSADGKTLYFVDQLTGTLRTLRLAQ